MQLIHDPLSTSSRIVTFFLHDHGIAFDAKKIDLAKGEQFQSAISAANPNCAVPILVDADGFTLTQSSAILRYVASQHGLDAYPVAPGERARVEEAMSWFQTNFHIYHCALYSYTYLLPMYQSLDEQMLTTIRMIGQGGSNKYLKVLDENMIGSRNYVCGGRITLADYVGAANVTLGYAAGMDFSSYPNVVRWLRTLRAHKGWKPAYAPFEAALEAARPQAAKVA